MRHSFLCIAALIITRLNYLEAGQAVINARTGNEFSDAFSFLLGDPIGINEGVSEVVRDESIISVSEWFDAARKQIPLLG